MKKKVKGRKGRPKIGKQRTFACSDEQYALIKSAAEKLGVKLSAFIRDAAVEKATSITGSDGSG